MRTPSPGATVLQVISDTNIRGAQTFAVDLGDSLTRLGRSVSTVALIPGPYGGLAVPTLGRVARGPRTLLELRRRAKRSAIVIAHGSTTLSASAVSTAGSGIPFVYRVIGDPAWWAGSGWRRQSVGAFLRRAAGVVVLDLASADVVSSRHRVPRERISVVPNGVPAERFPLATPSMRDEARLRFGLPTDVRVVAYLGALGPEKNVSAAIDAIRGLPDVVLAVAGSGPELDRLTEQAESRVPGQVRFLGSTTAPAQVLAAADVLVLPSWTEGMPAVLIEAGLTGIPAVASDVGAVREVIHDGVTGLLVPAGDVVRLAEGLASALADAGSMGEAARRRCLAQFTMDAVALGWAAVIDRSATPS